MEPKSTAQVEPENTAFFARWTEGVLRFRLVSILAIVAITGFFIAGMDGLSIDNSTERFTPENARSAQVLKDFRKHFGRDDVFLVLAEGDVFSPAFLDRLRSLHRALERLEVKGLGQGAPAESMEEAPNALQGIDAKDSFGDFEGFEGWGDEKDGSIVERVHSLINARRTYSKNDALLVERWLDPWPTKEGLSALRAAVLKDRNVRGVILSESTQHTVLAVRTLHLSDQDLATVHGVIEALVKKHGAEDFKLSVGGLPAVNTVVDRAITEDLDLLTTLELLALVLIMTLLFRHPLGVLGPLATVVLALVWSFGFAGWMGFPITLVSNILPPFFTCVGIGDSIHIQSLYRDHRRSGMETRPAIIAALGETGLPVMFTSLTTMVGLLSFGLSDVQGIREVGFVGAFGVGAAWLNSIVILPVVLSWNKKSLFGASKQTGNDPMGRLALALAGLSAKRPLAVFLPTGLLAAAALFGITQVKLFYDPLEWFPSDAPLRQTYKTYDEHVGGISNVQLLIKPKTELGLKDKKLLVALENLEKHLLAYEQPETGAHLVTGMTSIANVIKESNRALSDASEDAYRLPQSQQAISNLLFLFEVASSDELRRIATLDFQHTQATIRIRWLDATGYLPFTDYLEAGIKEHIGALASVRPTGTVYNLTSVIATLIYDLLYSFSLAFTVIAILMMLVVRRLKLGLIAMVPNLLPVAMILGVMGFSQIPIDVTNLLIASILLGICVDDTIHFFYHFRTSYEQLQDVEAAIRHTSLVSGRAIISTSIILLAGFGVFFFASVASLRQFGLLICLAIVFALLADLVLTPALLRIAYRKETT